MSGTHKVTWRGYLNFFWNKTGVSDWIGSEANTEHSIYNSKQLNLCIHGTAVLVCVGLAGKLHCWYKVCLCQKQFRYPLSKSLEENINPKLCPQLAPVPIVHNDRPLRVSLLSGGNHFKLSPRQITVHNKDSGLSCHLKPIFAADASLYSPQNPWIISQYQPTIETVNYDY